MCVLLVGLNINTESVSAHSGGTDEYGCHGGSRSYHCHNTGPTKEYLQNLKFNGMNARGGFKVVLKRHNSCESLNNLYLRGVAVSEKAAAKELGRITFRTLISKSLYKINRHLDTNNNGIACGFLEVENFRIPTYLCGTQDELWSPSLTANDTYSRCASSDPAMGGWKIEVLSVTPNAETAILAESDRNLPAPLGQQYFAAKLRVTNLNPQTARFPEEKLGTQSRSGARYTHFENSCGSLSNSFFLEDFSPGESQIANFCWRIYTVDADGLVLFFVRTIFTLDWTSSLTGTKFYKDSKGYSFIGMD
jgi:hypothetical protein